MIRSIRQIKCDYSGELAQRLKSGREMAQMLRSGGDPVAAQLVFTITDLLQAANT
ncbi:MAG: hypothetical protein V3U32_02885 [Anaerolineales bacterium]